MSEPIRLTQTVQKGGCAAKVAAVELRKILTHVEFPPLPKELVIGTATFDDAAVYQVSPETALVQTLDFFTPIVDTPRTFGRIAAANALSDVYAMGGIPKTAMAIFAFPLATMDSSVAVDVLQGASDAIRDAGACLVGGHTIDDDTLKFGLSVTGFVDPRRVWSNAGARAGDVLILTKALGTGTLTAALKRGEVSEEGIAPALASMSQLNDVPNILSEKLHSSIHAATDITGFGLAGHALNLARASNVRLEFNCADLPRFESALKFIAGGFLTKAHRTNAEYVSEYSSYSNSFSEDEKKLLFDPQTSGGLLLSVHPSVAEEMLRVLRSRFDQAQIVGSVKSPSERWLSFQ